MSQLLPERRRAAAAERWQPFQELEQVTERMRRLLEETFGGFGAWPAAMPQPAAWSPLVDIEERDDAYVLEAELPGVKREDVDIELVGNELVISGELRERERTGIIRRRTRRTGRFDYRVTLPEQVAADAIEATLADGVLTVRVPKSERAQRRRIEIKSS
ncbi:MAG TPA: Hsp20/alpha crystallin family protein [Gaiellaceae bacterium]|nr:Hsp20/alpha crystallin family protein [Gaiellaceae bacterium]